MSLALVGSVGRMMSRLDDQTYHRARAEAELQLAEAASDPGIAMVHRELAALHKRQMMQIVERGDAPDKQQWVVVGGH